MLTIIDDFSIKVWVFFLKHKSDVFSSFKYWKTMIEKQTWRHVKCIRTDNLSFVLMSLTLCARRMELLDIIQFIILHNRMVWRSV